MLLRGPDGFLSLFPGGEVQTFGGFVSFQRYNPVNMIGGSGPFNGLVAGLVLVVRLGVGFPFLAQGSSPGVPALGHSL